MNDPTREELVTDRDIEASDAPEVSNTTTFDKYSPFLTVLLFTIGPASALLQTIADSVETIEITSYSDA